MIADARFKKLDLEFWAHIRTISEELGYVRRKSKNCPEGGIRAPTFEEILDCMKKLKLDDKHLRNGDQPSSYCQLLMDYFAYRAEVITKHVHNSLMDAAAAKAAYEDYYKRKDQWTCKLPNNKQKGAKAGPAYLTCLVNMIISNNTIGHICEFDPGILTTVTHNGKPVRTFSRRLDGAFPSPINPIAVWEVKEYYYTTTFGSRIADGVYESQLDGMELVEFHESKAATIKVLHYLMVDAYFTWWVQGRSYLCRLIDMLHMGYADEVLFGKEVLDRLPELAKEWKAIAVSRGLTPAETQAAIEMALPAEKLEGTRAAIAVQRDQKPKDG